MRRVDIFCSVCAMPCVRPRGFALFYCVSDGPGSFLRAWHTYSYLASPLRANRMRLLCLLLVASPAITFGQQTMATYFIRNASSNLTANTLASAGLPSYSQTTFAYTEEISVWPDACPAGAFSYDDALVCSLCPAGKYSPTQTATGSETCLSCGTGKYSTAIGASAETTCVSCSNGTYSSSVGASAAATCLACPANATSYTGAQLLQACFCIPGHRGANGQACAPCNVSVWCLFGVANPCPSNSRSSPMSSSLTQCLCVSGYYGDATMGGPDLTLCQFCKENHWCPGGAVNASQACPDGKYSLPGADDVGDCNCPNSSSSRQNARYVSECICDSGYYKEYSGMYPLGGWYCRLCQVGEFCFNNTNRTCPAYATSFGVAKSYQDCYCNPGYRNATTGRSETNFCEDCPANYFCTGKGAVEACVANALSPTQSQEFSRCYCDLGYKGVNNTPCVACQSPTFCYSGLQATCPEGTFSPPLAFDRLNCSCIPGRWGPAGGPCILCGAGKYNMFPGCKACSNTTDVDCELCALGTASTSLGRNTTCDVCAAGTYSSPVNTRGALTCEPCGIGRVAPAGSSNCTVCAGGSFAAAGFSACVACVAGSFASGFVSVCTTCPVGTFAQAAASACVACSAGTFSAALGATSSATCSTCQIGTYAPARASSCIDCPANSWTSTTRAAKCTANTGFYNLDENLLAYYTFNPGDFLQDMTGITGDLTASVTPPVSQASGPFGGQSYSALIPGADSIDRNVIQYFQFPPMRLPSSVTICTWYWVSPDIIRSANRLWDFGNGDAVDNLIMSIAGTTTGLRFTAWAGGVGIANEEFGYGSGGNVWRHLCVGMSGTFARIWYQQILAVPSSILSSSRNYDALLTSSFLGSSNTMTVRSFYGAFDEFRIYGKFLSIAEMTGLYNFPGNASAPMIFLPCPTPCEAGKFGGCLSTTARNCVSCGAGTFSTGTGMTSVSTCQACRSGTFFTGIGATACTNCSVCAIGQYNVSNCNSSANIVCAACARPVVLAHETRYTFTSAGVAGDKSCSWCCNPGLWFQNNIVYGNHGCVGIAFFDPAWAYCGVKYACPANTYTGVSAQGSQAACKCNAGFTGVGGWNTTWQNFPVGTQLEPPPNWDGINCRPCIAGTYNTGTGVTISSRCIACATGTYSTGLAATASANCTSCHAGTFQTGTGANSSLACQNCQAGTFQTGLGFSLPQACQFCQPGTFQTGLGAVTSAACQNCRGGTYQTGSGMSSSLVCLACQSGKFSTTLGANSFATCLNCQAGTFSTSSGADANTTCMNCEPGTFSTALGGESSLTCENCKAGKFSTTHGRPVDCQPCPEGSFNPVQKSVNCSLCLAGAYSYSGLSACLLCGAGKFKLFLGCLRCSNSTDADCTPCLVGTASKVVGRSSNCPWCDAGTFSSPPNTPGAQTCGVCGNGTFSYEGSPECYSCPLGSYAPASSTACIQCPFHTYLDLPGQGSVSACKPCPAGTVLPFQGAQTVLACTPCEPGTYEVNRSCVACGDGLFSVSPGATACQTCPNGTIGSRGTAQCQECPLGTYAPAGSKTCLECPFHTYLDRQYAGSVQDCIPCPPGTFSRVLAAASLDMCYPCQAGTYEQNRNCQDCGLGRFGPAPGATTCLVCQEGNFSSLQNATACQRCIPGTFMTGSGFSGCQACQPGTYSSSSSSTACFSCSRGEYMPTTAATQCLECPRGLFGRDNATTSCLACGPGEFTSQSGRTVCNACPIGTSHNDSARFDCTPCKNGTFAASRSNQVNTR